MTRTPSHRLGACLGVAAALGNAVPASAQTAPSQPDAGAADASVAAATVLPPPLGESLTGGAKRDYEEARLLFEDGDFSGGLLKFMTAYEQSRDPRLLWDAAVCEKASHHYAKALSYVRRYLESASPLISPEAIARANAFVAAAEPLTALVEMTSDPAAAAVTVDGEEVGVTPLPEAVRLDIGPHQMQVRKAGFQDWSTSLSITGAGPLPVRAVLVPVERFGRLVVRAAPSDAVAVDGRIVGAGGWEGLLRAGRHALRVTAPATRPFAQDVVVEADQTRTFDVKLEPAARGIQPWIWVVGSAVVAAGAATAAYFAFRPSDQSAPPAAGTAATVRLP